MQIRLTVLRPRSGQTGTGSSTDVLVTAPDGTALGAVAGALAGAVGVRGPRAATHVHLYAGRRRVEEQTLLGHPPLVDGAVLALNEPDPEADDDPAPAATELRVVGGPDAGGVHRLHGPEIRVGRSSEMDIPLDDPDVSRVHLALHLAPDGQVTVQDLGSTNGTVLDGQYVRETPVELAPGGLIRLGETTLQLGIGDNSGSPRPPVPDGHGHLRLPAAAPAKPPVAPPAPAADPEPAGSGSRARALLSRFGRGGGTPEPSMVEQHAAAQARQAAVQRERWPDPATLLLHTLGPGPRLWERGPAHPDALTVRLGTADLPGGPGTAPGTLLPAVPVTIDLRRTGSLGLAGPRDRAGGLARSVVAQLAALHPPSSLSLVLICADGERVPDWSWALWLPHLRPAAGQECRALVGFTPEQARARLTELSGLASPPSTVVLVDGDPGSPEGRRALDLLIEQGPAVGVFTVCLAERADQLPARLGATAEVTGEVATQLTVDRPAGGTRERLDEVSLDAVSPAWAERLARLLAPLREAAPVSRGPLPESLRLLDLLRLDSVTPAKLSARWAGQPDGGGPAVALLGTARDGLCTIDLADEDLTDPAEPGGPHLLIGGARGSGKTELLRTLIASLAVNERPERLSVTVVEGRGHADDSAGLHSCTELPHVTTHLDAAADPRQALLLAESLLDELAHRAQLFGEQDFASWQAARALATAPALVGARGAGDVRIPSQPRTGSEPHRAAAVPPRLLVVVDDYEALLSPTSPGGRPLVRAFAAIAERGGRLGMHLAVTTSAPDQSTGSELDDAALLRIALRTDQPGDSDLLIHLPDAAALPEDTPGRGYLRRPDGGVTAFQAARVSGRIPRTATLRPTVVALDPIDLGAPPTRRPVRELGNGPTDLALLASALQRAAGQ